MKSNNADEKEIESKLVSLGLNVKEAKVYIALLNLGEVGTSKIISHTGLHGQFVYQALEKLEKKNLVQNVISRGRKKFSAKKPSALVNLAEIKMKTAEEVVEEITKGYALSETQNFNVFRGRDAFVADQFEMLSKTPNGSVIKVIGGNHDRYVQDMGNDFEEYEFQRKKKGIVVNYLVNEKGAEYTKKFHEPRSDFITKTLPGSFPGDVNTGIYPNYLSFVIFADTTYTIRMESKKIAEGYANFFDTLWGLGK